MAGGIVTIGRRQYAVGLYWENSPSGRVSQAAKEAARQPGQQAAYFAVRPRSKNGRVPQFGLSPEDVPYRIGMPVLAACLANQQPGSWAGAFKLREGVVLVIVRDDLLVPDGDLFFGDETEARDRLLQEMGFGGLQRVYAPDAWGVPGADTMPLSLLLNDRSDIRLQPVAIPKAVVIGGLVFAFLLVSVVGGGWYYQDMKEKEEEARQQKIREEIEIKRRLSLPDALMQKPIDYPPPERKWEKKPLALDVVRACQKGLKKVPISTVGWNLSSTKCDGTSLSMIWQKTAGFSRPPEGSTVNDSAQSATLTISLEKPAVRSEEKLMDPTDVTRRILAQNWVANVGRAAPDPLPPPPPDFKGKWEPPSPPWVKRSFTLAVPVLPWTLATFFKEFPGLVLNSVSSSQNGTNATWTVEGVIYENRR